MASTAKAARVIKDLVALNAQLVELHSQLQKTLGRFTHNGGESFLHPFFMEADGVTPRTDLDFTEAQLLLSRTNQQLVYQRLDNLIASFIQAE